MLSELTVVACAKLNLGLKVFPRRADGFHDIVSIFRNINLYDRLRISVSDKEGCRVHSAFDLPQENTLTKAYKAFCVLTGIKKGIDVQLEKHIPAGGGLGGGSSDASSLIISLDKLFNTQLTPSELLRISGSVGSDCFFFTSSIIENGTEALFDYVPYAAVIEGSIQLDLSFSCDLINLSFFGGF